MTTMVMTTTAATRCLAGDQFLLSTNSLSEVKATAPYVRLTSNLGNRSRPINLTSCRVSREMRQAAMIQINGIGKRLKASLISGIILVQVDIENRCLTFAITYPLVICDDAARNPGIGKRPSAIRSCFASSLTLFFYGHCTHQVKRILGFGFKVVGEIY